jgi:hypothetical protein
MEFLAEKKLRYNVSLTNIRRVNRRNLQDRYMKLKTQVSPDNKKLIKRKANLDLIDIRSHKQLIRMDTFVKKHN